MNPQSWSEPAELYINLISPQRIFLKHTATVWGHCTVGYTTSSTTSSIHATYHTDHIDASPNYHIVFAVLPCQSTKWFQLVSTAIVPIFITNLCLQTIAWQTCAPCTYHAPLSWPSQILVPWSWTHLWEWASHQAHVPLVSPSDRSPFSVHGI